MANTIGTGSANAIPFYNAAGTDLVPMTGGVSYDKTNKILSIPGFSINKPVYTGGYGFSGMSFQNFFAGQPVNTFNFVRGRGNFTTKSVPLSGDQLANIVMAGWGGSSPVVGANIKAVLVGTANTTSMPTELIFSTNNGTSLADRLKITKDGQLNVNTISNFSGNDLSLSPTGQVVLGAPSKVKITGGTSGQVLSTDGSGNLSWATVSGGGTQTSAIVTTVGNLTPDFDLAGGGTVNSADALAFLKFGLRNQSTGPVLTSYEWIRGDWGTGKAHATIAVVEGEAINALRVAVGQQPSVESGDTIFIGNTTAAGRADIGLAVLGKQVVLQAFDEKSNSNAGADMVISSSTDGASTRGAWTVRGDVNTNGIVKAGVALRTSSFTDDITRNNIISTPATGMIVVSGGKFQGYTGTAWEQLGPTSGSEQVDLTTSGTPFSSFTIDSGTLNWYRIGNYCHWELYMNAYGFAGGSGTLKIEGLPFNAAVDVASFSYGTPIRVDVGDVTSDSLAYPRYYNGQSYMVLASTKAGGLNNANISAAHVVTATGIVLIGQGHFKIDVSGIVSAPVSEADLNNQPPAIGN